MRLIAEIVEDVQIINEENSKNLFIEGVFLQKILA